MPSDKNHDEIWNRDHERFAAGLMTEAQVERRIAYWLEAAGTCGEELRAIEFRDFAWYMADSMQQEKDHALYKELGERYGLQIYEVRDLIRRYEETNNV